MRNDTRLSRMLHVLIHMARHEGPATSEAIGQMLGTNPVVVRRTMALLKNEGYVSSEKGHRGGWRLAKPLADITLLDIHQALGASSIFAIGLSTDHPECLVEQAVNEALGEAFEAAQALLPSAWGASRWSSWRASSSAAIGPAEAPRRAVRHRRRACGGTPAVRDQSEYFTVNIRLRGSP